MNLLGIRHTFTGIRGMQRLLASTNRELLQVQDKHSNYIIRTSSTKKHNSLPNDLPTKLTQAQKLKKAIAEYGTTVVVFHVSISLMSLGACYVLVSSGVDVSQLLATLKLSDAFNTKFVSNAGTLAVAYAIHKMFAPVRIGITLGSVPFIVRYLRHKGILKK